MPFKLSLPKLKLSKMRYNFAPVLHNKIVLYAFLAMTIIQIVFFVNRGDMAAVITLGLVGFITSFFSKNMIVILCIALTVSSLLSFGIKSNISEGLENKDDASNSDGKSEENKDGKSEENKDGKSEENKDGKSEENKDGKSQEKKSDTDKNNKNGETNSVESSDKTKDEIKEQYNNMKKEYPEFKEVQAEIMKGIEKMDPLLQKAETFIEKYSNYTK